MKIETLEYFLTLAESQSINEASEKLFIAQPSLTKALQKLEKELGFQLFARSNTGIELTEMGRIILPEIREVVAYYKGWLEMSAKNTLKHVDIYAFVSFSDFLIPSIMFQFKKIYPEITINFTSCNHPEQHLSKNATSPTLCIFVCDKGNKMYHYADRYNNTPVVLMNGKYKCLVSPSSPLAKKQAVTAEDLKKAILVMPESKEFDDLETFTQLIRVFKKVPADNILDVASLANTINTVIERPETFAISYSPALRRYPAVKAGQLVDIPFDEDYEQGSLCLFYNKKAYERHPALQLLIKMIQESAAKFVRTECGEHGGNC